MPANKLPARSPLAGEQTKQGQRPQLSRGGKEAQQRARAKRLRKDATIWEQKLWRQLKHEQLGVSFRRQQPIGPYIVDFVCFVAKLVIELDGSQHAAATADDKKRDAVIRDKGYRVLRFWNNDIDTNMDAVLKMIQDALSPHQIREDGFGSPARGELAPETGA